ncbi:MAG: AAA family ATPase [Phycisphaerales bacterium]|nr:AAA family ATPase [Phycisphaerales bacterium]
MTTRKAPRVRISETTPAVGSPGDPVLSAHASVVLARGIVGHEQAKRTLGVALSSGHLPHAWIFHGPAGIGKCTMALALAALVVDPEATDADRASFSPRRQGRSAEALRFGIHPDARIIRADLASTSADRELRQRKQANIPIGLLREHLIGGGERGSASFDAPVYRSSVFGAGKAFIIDEAERLEPDAQNTLLKTLEEPPPGTIIVLVTTSIDRLLPTIRSRCQRVAMHALAPAEMSAWLDEHLRQVTGSDRKFIEAFADGSPGAAVTAVELGMQAWFVELSPLIDRVVKGECPPGMSERMHDIASEVAEAAVRRDPQASKDAANRRAIGLIFALLGSEVRRRMSAAQASVRAIDYWSEVPPLISRAETHIRANVNLKLALADFVAQWSQVRSRFA